RRQPLLSADDMRYLHQIIIDHTGKVVRWHPVRFHEYLVIDLRRMNHYPSPDHVVEPDFFLAWNFESYDVGSPGGYEIFHFIRAQRKRISHFEARNAVVLLDRYTRSFKPLPHSLKLFFRIERIVGQTFVDQFLRILLVNLL